MYIYALLKAGTILNPLFLSFESRLPNAGKAGRIRFRLLRLGLSHS